ncbi:MAG: phospho-sugar mutase [Puniceicoccaceae bacterium]|nr:MAG: phospho-sugar mutase [Puniceicoccaceae bacterium]
MDAAALLSKVEEAGQDNRLLDSAVQNLRDWLSGDFLPAWARQSLAELIEAEEFEELNDRFFRYLEFGTGGMRGRTIGKVTTPAERGASAAGATPEHPAVGANLLNDFTVIRATVGLFRYTAAFLAENGIDDLPRLVIAHDVRHFSRHFCELAASTWNRLGGVAFIFDGPRSTPQLSFSVRHLKAHAGVVITASHNPPHDNGYKVYFSDGAQVVPPHDKGIIAKVNAVGLEELPAFLEIDCGRVVTLGPNADVAYTACVRSTVLDPERLRESKLKAVFTPIHGTGATALPILRDAGVDLTVVPEQEKPDPNFSTVKSPNPENAEALELALRLAGEVGAEVVMGTDPDCDRMGVAVRNREGKLELLTGNQIGALLAEYRLRRLKELGWLPADGTRSAALIKTFVTSPLQDAIGRAHGVKVINTLTGFKWIGEKLKDYESQLREKLLAFDGTALDHDATTPRRKAELLLRHSTFYVFGGEESYGYLPADGVRDKDGNAACLIFCELAAWLKADGRTVPEFLDELYLTYGYHLEALGQIYYEGAAGAAKIHRILETYRASPPKKLDGIGVSKFTDFGRETIIDADGKRIPPQDLYFLELDNGWSYAVRGSGTEPKIKFYLFARREVDDPARLADAKKETAAALDRLREAIEQEAASRAEAKA